MPTCAHGTAASGRTSASSAPPDPVRNGVFVGSSAPDYAAGHHARTWCLPAGGAALADLDEDSTGILEQLQTIIESREHVAGDGARLGHAR